MIKNYIFDLDGTIVNSSQEILACFKKAFEKSNYEIDETRLTSNVIGPPLTEILKTIAPEIKDEEKLDEIGKNFRKIYDNNNEHFGLMYEGMFDYLNWLKQQDFNVFVATFKPMVPTIRIVKMLRLEAIFDDIYTIDKFGGNFSKEEMVRDILDVYELNAEETAMIGDAPTDMKAGKVNRVKAVGVLWGYGVDKQPLIDAADIVVKNVAELKERLK